MNHPDRATRRLTVISVVVLILLGVTAISLFENQQRQVSLSSYSVKPDGYYVTYTLLTHIFPGKVLRCNSNFTELLEKGENVVITPRTEWSDTERSLAMRWIKRGGVLILLSPMPEDLGVATTDHKTLPNPEWPGFRDLPSYHPTSSQVLKLHKDDVPLYYSKRGIKVAIRRIGQGRRVVFANSLTNKFLVKHPEGAAILGKLVAVYLKDHSLVLWDEGFLNILPSNNRSKSESLAEKSAIKWNSFWISLFIMAQIFIVAVFYTVARGMRFGKPIILQNQTELTLRDYIRSLTGFYYRAGARSVVLEELYLDLRSRLLKIAGLNHSASNEMLVEKVSHVIPIDSKRLNVLLVEAQTALDREAISERQLYRFGRQMDQIRREIEKYGFNH
ncbi:MAG TPA: hypothetical protein VHR47_04395 [Bacillota bacterium]|nr:hypothetical protein [Bacillota bacterium]